LAAIDHAQLEFAFEVARLRRRERIVKDRHSRFSDARNLSDLDGFAFSDKCAGVGSLEALADGCLDAGARALGQRLEFRERFLAGDAGMTAQVNSDQDGSIATFAGYAIQSLKEPPWPIPPLKPSVADPNPWSIREEPQPGDLKRP